MKRGFTLIELLAVIVIFSIILLIAIPIITNTIEKSKINAVVSNNKMILKGLDLYVLKNETALPNNIGDTIEISIQDLIAGNYISEVKSSFTGNSCTGYILITKTENDYIKIPHINCLEEINNSTDDKLLSHYTFDDFQEPTMNLIPNSPINSYPKINNTHGTYNTNQYNSDTFFSIGTIGSVTDNIVTLSSIGRTIRTYDVLRPQTTGGGVVANTNYFIKKISNDSFSLHQYNSSQDGSLGFKTHESIEKDQRININSTDFPTMWKGAPHLPNSALVKEIIPNCYNNHECIRLITSHKPEGDVDGMAYGVYPPVEQGKKYSFSFYYRAVDQQTVGKTIRLSMHTGTGWPSESGKVVTINNMDWNRYEITSIAPNTGGTNLYFWPSKGANIDITEIQVEKKDYTTPFAITTRGGTIKDYSKNDNTLTLDINNTPRWVGDKNGSYLFNGINSFIDMNYGLNENLNNHTISLWVKTNSPAASSMFLSSGQAFGVNDRMYLGTLNGKWDMGIQNYTWGSGTISTNTNWNHIVITFNGSQAVMYVNKEHNRTINYSPYTLKRNLYLGKHDNDYYFNGYIDDVRIYNRVLSEKEISLLYESTK